MRIKEMAEQLQISPRAIRFYEQKGLVHPKKHPENNYREFSEQDAWRLQLIIALREVGISLEDVKEILAQIEAGSHQDVLKLLDFQRFMLYSQWTELKQIIQTMDQMIALLERRESLAWQDIFKLADGSKRLRDLRKNWVDQWNFDQQAEIHDQLVYQDQEFSFHPRYDEALQRIVHLIDPKPGEQGLDIGAGTGNLVQLLHQRNARMTAIDQSKEMLAKCKEKNPTVETKLGNFLAIPYLDHSFDFIVTSYAFRHLSEEQKQLAIDEMKRVLKPQGRIALLDLMYMDEQDQERIQHMLYENNQGHIVRELESKCLAYVNNVVQQFKNLGMQTKTYQLDHMLHLIYVQG